MISVIIPSFNAETLLVPTLNALVPGAIAGVISEAILADGGSTDATCEIADAAGMRIVQCEHDRGSQLRSGAAAAKGRWLLFLGVGTVLDPAWLDQAAQFVARQEQGDAAEAAAVFRFALDNEGLMPRILEGLVALRFHIFRLAGSDQGLLISRSLYDRLGGLPPVPLTEDLAMMRKLKRRQLVLLRARAVTSAERYRQGGYLARSLRELSRMLLYSLHVPQRLLFRLYSGL